MFDKQIAQFKSELEKMENRKEAIIAETSIKREERMIEAHRLERDNLKSEVNLLKAEIYELNKMIAERSEQIEELDEKVKHLKESIEYYEESKIMKELATELDLVKLRFFNLTAKAVEKGDLRFFQNVIDDVLDRANVNVKYLGVIRVITKRESEGFTADRFDELMDKIGRKYGKIRSDYFSERKTSDSSLIVMHNGVSVKYVEDWRKLKDGDKITIGTVVSGGWWWLVHAKPTKFRSQI